MTELAFKEAWLEEEQQAEIRGWDFSHIRDRYREEGDLPWDYRTIVGEHLREEAVLLDYDTGGGEFLLSLRHPYERTAATEGYPPNVALCRERLLPLGIDFRACQDPGAIPFPDESFDIILNRHGSFEAGELFRLLKKGGLFITQQVGGDNDRDLVERVRPGTPKPFPHLYLAEQLRVFRGAGFRILRGEEAYRPIQFFDVGAFVWFARVLPWEFPDFSVEMCFAGLWGMQEEIQQRGRVEGTVHRYLIVAEK
ncbi:MAG: class I SAM-dependent methyltransferase [Angelakisella sp.]|nr:class I SAM-dependent methyltransferase [Angelakisella sp.]MCI9529127.1 class I SAM-dependent methyltransferase [Angelakisella sp.]